MKTLQQRLKWARKRAGKTQRQMAEFLKIDQSSYSNTESGKSLRSTYTAEIAEFLGVNAYWLATGLGNPDPLADDELYAMFSRLPEDQKDAVLRLVRSMRTDKTLQ